MSLMSIVSLLAGLGIFLFGMHMMGEELEKAAGTRLKGLLEVVTRNRVLAMLAGVAITAVVQSSTATTVMVVGFVNASLLSLTQAVGDELRSKGIRINVICPGPVDTELFQKSERRQFILDAGGDVFDTDTVANGILFLASDLSKGMNSQTLVMRGFNRW